MCQRQRTEGAAIQDAVNEVDLLDWPSTEGNLVNEFKTDGLATMAFPTLFPYGKGGDPTNSAADIHWPDLQRLLQKDEGASRSERAQAVIDNPHLTDWFFMQQLEFVRHWLNGVLDAEWHWYRFEYQARGSIHCHGCAKLKNDPDIRKLHKACVAFLESETTRNDSQVVKDSKSAPSQVVNLTKFVQLVKSVKFHNSLQLVRNVSRVLKDLIVQEPSGELHKICTTR
ncbi:Hypothetical predicted protein [Paramuricea clavata]|uniref:Uncharacterized protein n=1 Tax=Paramuricea clavata TaxID=317549 RepID=A0A6S7HVW6_PARCT|nr:Hypothetical predicted protein [Paramuricea clavata]